MKTSALRASALFAGCVVITACSQTTELSRLQYTPNVSGESDRAASPLSYRVLHRFGKDHDGDGPIDGVIAVGGTLFGTTSGGGLYGGGTVFSITTDGGAEKVLHSFGQRAKGIKGSQPYGGVIDVGGTLYGTTGYGGGFGYGTVFSVTADGAEKVLHGFGESPDGEVPSENLIAVGSTLYGTTEGGGRYTGFRAADGYGTVFSITTDGKEKVLHSFGKGTDGRFGGAGLTEVSGILYSTTIDGGAYDRGTVFSITTGGKEKVLHSFGGTPDGAGPAYTSLIAVKGTLYGTTESGGTQDAGTVFSVTRGGSEKVLHSFGKGTDGNFPAGGLIDIGGTLYGTTINGGAYGLGTLFSITTGGSEKVRYSFSKGTDGNGPIDALVYEGGSIFGATQSGGIDDAGVLFSLTP
ncbi:MAG: choice-of-anchor tandem repeat GloVer-containing protein [Candidatus Cybelea sp.]